jgi:hypothetical protein
MRAGYGAGRGGVKDHLAGSLPWARSEPAPGGAVDPDVGLCDDSCTPPEARMMKTSITSALIALIALFAVAEDARADFLVLKSGRSFGGTLHTFEDGSVTTDQASFRYSRKLVARTSTAKTVDEAIEEWAKDIGDKTSTEAREGRLILGKFCVFHKKYKDAEKYFAAWGKPRKWKVSTSKYYFVLSDAKEKRVKEVRARLDAIVTFYQKEFKAKGKLNRDFVVRFFESERAFDEFAKQAGMDGAGAFYDPDLRELVLYDMSVTNKQDTFKAVYHEANHQFVGTYLLSHEPDHAWFCEGLATYYETAKFKGGRIVSHGKKQIDYLMTVKEAIRNNELTPWADVLTMKSKKFYCGGSRESLNYAQVWSLIYFFRNTKDKKARKFFDRYLEALKELKDDDKALAEAFKVASAEDIATAYEAFERKL